VDGFGTGSGCGGNGIALAGTVKLPVDGFGTGCGKCALAVDWSGPGGKCALAVGWSGGTDVKFLGLGWNGTGPGVLGTGPGG
jgi:hypothetical protein